MTNPEERPTFGKRIHFDRIQPDTVPILRSLFDFSQIKMQDKWTIYDLADFLTEEINFEQTRPCICKVRAILDRLAKKGGLEKTVTIKKPTRGNPQFYRFISNLWTYTEGKKRVYKKRKIKEEAEKIKKTEPVKRRLTLEDIHDFDIMDLGFVGYCLRTDADILQKTNESLEAEIKKIKSQTAESQQDLIEEALKPYVAKINQQAREIENLKKQHKEELDEKEKCVGKLNMKLIDANNYIDKLEKALARDSQRNGFSIEELAFPKGRPTYLKKGDKP